MHRLFLDANVLFTAAHNPEGKAALLFDALDLKRWLGEGSLTVSLGVTVSRSGHDAPSDMLRRADTALYAAKHSGRNRVAISGNAAGNEQRATA